MKTTIKDERVRPALDLMDRNFYAAEPNQLWVADITYVPTWVGFLYLAVVLDAFSRRIVGWAMGNDLKTQIVMDAMCESFFATLECELLDRREFRTKAKAGMAIFEFIEGWYNPGRRHSALGYRSPINYEREALERLEMSST